MKKNSLLKTILIITTICILLCSSMFLLTSCNARSEFFDLAICGSYAVPGMYCDDLKDNSVSCNVIEYDSYGRILFEYETYSIITRQNETAYEIPTYFTSNRVSYKFDENGIFRVYNVRSTEDYYVLATINPSEKKVII